jgi:hypothetical protein
MEMEKLFERIVAILDANRKAQQEEIEAWREETRSMQFETTNTRTETMACQEMEARPEEKKPTSVDMKPEVAEEREVPEENATVMPVEEPKKKRRRDRQLAAERRRQKQKNSTLESCGPLKELALARRGTTCRAKVAWKAPIDDVLPCSSGMAK